jgi:hypothetical protein
MQAAAEAGIAASSAGSAARRRPTQMHDFYEFLLDEIPEILERWRRRTGQD